MEHVVRELDVPARVDERGNGQGGLGPRYGALGTTSNPPASPKASGGGGFVPGGGGLTGLGAGFPLHATFTPRPVFH